MRKIVQRKISGPGERVEHWIQSKELHGIMGMAVE